MPLNNETIFQWTQSIVAILVVLGGGAAIILRPDIKDSLIGIIGVVIGFYFGGMVQNRNATQVKEQSITTTKTES